MDVTGEKKIVAELTRILELINQAGISFGNGVKCFLEEDSHEFASCLENISRCEEETSSIRRHVEGMLYTSTVFLRSRGDLMRLLELMDYMVNIMYKNLYQFEIENPFFPDDVTEDFLTLADYSTKAVEGVIPAAEAYFQKPETVASRLHRIYNFQKKADKLSQSIKWRVFHSMDFLKLSQKFHLRYFALHIENISEAAGRIADQLSVMAIKHEDQQTALNSEEKMKAFRDFEQNLFHRMKFNEDIGGLYSDASTVQKDFSQRITNLYPNLSASEKKLATLLRLDFSTKDIATMMNITPKSVEIARYRLRTKLKLKRSDNLVEFIKTI